LHKKRVLLGLLILSTVLTSLSAQEDAPEIIAVDYHIKGDQVFSIEAGLFLPLFFADFTPGDSDKGALSSTNLSLGGSGFLSYCGYLNNHWRIGGEFGGIFAYSPNENLFSMVPIMVKSSYEIYLNQQFSLPLYLSAGISLTSYLDNFRVDPILIPGIGFFWNYGAEWSFGVKYNYWLVAEIFEEEKYTILGNFSDVKLAVEYHF